MSTSLLWPESPEESGITGYSYNLNNQNRNSLVQLAFFIAGLFEVPAVLINVTASNGQTVNQISYGLDQMQLGNLETIFQSCPALWLKEQVIEDIQLDPAFATSAPITAKPALRFFAAIPLQTQVTNCLGTLCLLDWQPRVLSAAQFVRLQELADIAASQLELSQQAPDLVEIDNKVREISQLIAPLTGEEFFHTLVQQIATTLEAEYVFIGELLGGGQLNFRTLATYERGQLCENFEATLMNTPAQAIINQQMAIYPSGVQTYFPQDPLLKSNQIESYLAIPLVSFNGTVLGLLAVMSRQPLKDFRMARSLFQMFGSRITIELEHRQVEQRLVLQYNLTKVLAEAESLKAATSLILKAIGESLKCEVGLFWKTDQKANRLRCVETWHTAGKDFAEFEKISRETTFSPGEGLWGELWNSKQPFWFTEIAGNTNFVRGSVALKAGLHSVIGFPIISNGGMLGYIEFLDCEMRYPDHKLLQLFLAIGAQVGQFMERKQAEEALRRSMRTNRALLDALPDVMFRVSRDGTYVNYKVPQNSNFITPPEKFMGKKLSDVLPPELAQVGLQHIISVLENGGVESMEYQLKLGNKIHTAGYYEARFVTSAEDEVMIIIRDISERKQAEEELHNTLQKEKELSELKSRFVSMTSHEFRTPLATILTNAEMLKQYSDRLSEEKKQALFQRIELAIVQMTDLLNDVLVIGKAEAGRLDFNPVELNLTQFCQTVTEEIQLGIGKKHRLNFIYPNQTQNTRASVDEKLLRHILTNLLSNAIKYSLPDSLIQFELAYDMNESEPKAIFQIKDQGIGIPAEDQKRMFEIFHRARNVGTIQGTGLGLAIVKRSIEMHQGTIKVQSTVGEGTTITITVPLNNISNQGEN